MIRSTSRERQPIMKTVYVESSVIGYLTARPGRDIVVSARQAITTEWWEDCRDSFEIFISELVIEEVGSGDSIAAQKRLAITEKLPILEATRNAKELAEKLVTGKAIPPSSTEDALHISIAAVQRIDFLLTWNFKHINNATTRENISEIIRENGYTCPVLCSPEELLNEE